MAESKKRIALKPHMNEIREWVDAGKTDDWIATALGTSASSVQSFRSRNDIYRRERGGREPESIFEGVLDHGEREGWGLWLDPAVAEDPIWREHWSDVEAVIVKVAEDSIVLEADRDETKPPVTLDGAGTSRISSEPTPTAATDANTSIGETPATDEASPETIPEETEDGPRERGRVKWFDPEKGYGFLVRPSKEDLFVHHTEVQGEPAEMTPNSEVEYEVGQNERGPNARRVRLVE